jgi:hypothetical protein
MTAMNEQVEETFWIVFMPVPAPKGGECHVAVRVDVTSDGQRQAGGFICPACKSILSPETVKALRYLRILAVTCGKCKEDAPHPSLVCRACAKRLN